MGAGTPMAGAGFQPSRLLSAARALAPAPHINHNHTATCDTKHHFIPQGPPWNRPSALLEPPLSLPRFPLIPKEAPRGGVDPNVGGSAPPSELPLGLLRTPFCHLDSAPESAPLPGPLVGALRFGTGPAEVLRSR